MQKDCVLGHAAVGMSVRPCVSMWLLSCIPNSYSYFILSCLVFSSILTLRDYVLELGHPYLWVQKLGGLHFPKEQPQVCILTLPP